MSDEKKCIHRMNMKGHGDPWCTLFRKTADCDLCYGVGSGTNHTLIKSLGFPLSEDRCHRGGTLRNAVGSKTGPIFTKHHETVMKRSKAEKMQQLFTVYGGTPEQMIQLRRLDSLSVNLQMEASQLNYGRMMEELVGRPGVSLLHDEFVIDQKEWVSPFIEGELVTYCDQLARVVKIMGPVITIKLQARHSINHLDVMDWDIEKRSVVKWVVKYWRKLWHRV